MLDSEIATDMLNDIERAVEKYGLDVAGYDNGDDYFFEVILIPNREK